MKNLDYSDMVRLLKKPEGEITFVDMDKDLIHMTLGISGEAGELLDAVKKAVIYGQPLDLDNVIEELGDLEFYMEGLRQALQISRQQCLLQNFRKLMHKRYPDGYSDAAALARADKEN